MQVVVRSSLLFNNLILLCFAMVKCEQQARQASTFSEAKRDVSMNELRSDYTSFMSILNSIAIKRVSGTAGNQIVRKYIADSMKNYGWKVEVLPFSDRTPYGVKDFANVIATYPIGRQYKANPSANTNTNNRIVFACHYDSKFFNGQEFIGATDSAVPCAILIEIAKYLYENHNPSDFDGLYRHLQFMFFDGEEAFGQWTATDSLYGARNYAASLKKTYGSAAFKTMDMFVLLDLIGGDATRYLNYFPQSTSNAYRMLNSIEKSLKSKRMLSGAHSYFTDLGGAGRYAGVEDDHLPFLRQNVPILHLIPSPFPSQWHTLRDNVQNLDMNHVQDMRLIMKQFVLQILNDKMEATNKEDELTSHRADDEF